MRNLSGVRSVSRYELKFSGSKSLEIFSCAAGKLARACSWLRAWPVKVLRAQEVANFLLQLKKGNPLDTNVWRPITASPGRKAKACPRKPKALAEAACNTQPHGAETPLLGNLATDPHLCNGDIKPGETHLSRRKPQDTVDCTAASGPHERHSYSSEKLGSAVAASTFACCGCAAVAKRIWAPVSSHDSSSGTRCGFCSGGPLDLSGLLYIQINLNNMSNGLIADLGLRLEALLMHSLPDKARSTVARL